MASPIPVYFPPTFDPVIDAMTHGYGWLLGPDGSVDWSISNGFAGEFLVNPNLAATYALEMFGTFSYYANIDFNYLGYFATPSIAYQAGSEITLTLSGLSALFPSNSIWAKAFFPIPNSNQYYLGEAGDIYLNPESVTPPMKHLHPAGANL